MPRYVILEHDHPTLHWDLMLETGATLRTWRLSTLPASEHSVDATALPDHRSFYLDYEGPLSGNRVPLFGGMPERIAANKMRR